MDQGVDRKAIKMLESTCITRIWVKKLMAKDSGFQNLNFVPVGEKLSTWQRRCYVTNSDYSVND